MTTTNKATNSHFTFHSLISMLLFLLRQNNSIQKKVQQGLSYATNFRVILFVDKRVTKM